MEYSTSTIPATKTASCSVWHAALMYFSFFQCSSVHVKYTLGMCWLVGTVVTCTVVSLHHRGQSAHPHSDEGIKAHSSYLHKELPWAQVTDFTPCNPASSIGVLVSQSSHVISCHMYQCYYHEKSSPCLLLVLDAQAYSCTQ